MHIDGALHDMLTRNNKLIYYNWSLLNISFNFVEARTADQEKVDC